MSVPKGQRSVVVTGFGPFQEHETNASWSAVRKLSDLWNDKSIRLVVEEIPVSYDFVQKSVPNKWVDEAKPEGHVLATFHVGVSSKADKVTLETTASNGGYSRLDVHGRIPSCQQCMAHQPKEQKRITNFNLSFVKNREDVEISNDAGLYLCEFVYYKSLEAMNGNSLFIHVPCEDVLDSDKVSKTILDVLETVLRCAEM